MASLFGWLDSSERDRRRALDAIDLLKQKETLDELGIGSIRDTIADIQSPGTSTIQTRARYFFFIPWIYLSLEQGGVNSEQIAARARRKEIELIEELSKCTDSAGTIGVEAGASLKRLPSMIYWAGLGRLGFKLFPGSQEQYHRAFRRNAFHVRRDESGDIGLDVALPGNWNPHLPEAPDEYPEGATFKLRREESEFFREQLHSRAPESLLRILVEFSDETLDFDFPWEHPRLLEMPPHLQQWLVWGQCFAEVMHGAQLLYNLMLAEKRYHTEWIERYTGLLQEWCQLVSIRSSVYQQWDRTAFWGALRRENPRLPHGAENFSEQWIRSVLASSDPAKLMTDTQSRELITKREWELKKGRARLQSPAHLELWGGASGSERLNYRWGITRTLVRDIVDGLRN